MPTYTVNIYNNDPLFTISSTVGATTAWTGEASPSGTATITDNEAGIEGQTLDDAAAGGETATGDVTVGGNTSIGASVYAEEAWTLLDTETGKTFTLITLRVDDGPATGYYTLSEQPLVVGRNYEVVAFTNNADVLAGDPAFNIDNFVDETGFGVEGTGGDDVIDLAYSDDDGDSLGDGDDLVSTGDGDDSVVGSGGDDTIIGSGGSDTLNGGDGDDTIIGGNNGSFATSAEFLNWSAAGADEASIAAGFSQQTGEIVVDVGFTDDGDNNPTFTVESTDTEYTEAGEPFNTTSGAAVFGNGDGATATVTLDFAAAPGSVYQDEVENVQFRLNDIDSFAGNHIDTITVNAFDADGNPVPIVFTVAGDETVVGNTITAGGALDDPDDANGSVLVEIAGPVAQVEIIYSNGLTGTHGLNITDVHFDAVPSVDGEDVLNGGAGDDTLSGEEGDDTLDGGTGADQMSGGDGDDEFAVAEGDTADGGDGNDLFILNDLGEAGASTITIIGGETGETTGDTLQLTSDVSQSDITFTNTDDDAGGLSGTFALADGTVVTFSEIENIICFTTGAMILTPNGERPIESLKIGDLLITRDHGAQPIRWIGKRTVTGRGKLAPIEIDARVLEGATNSILVSPQHRVLFSGFHAQLLFGEPEVLVAAKHLLKSKSARTAPCDIVTYYHLMLDQHEVIYADGAATESFHAHDHGLRAITDSSRDEMFNIFPELRSNLPSYGDTVRICLKNHEVNLLLQAA